VNIFAFCLFVALSVFFLSLFLLLNLRKINAFVLSKLSVYSPEAKISFCTTLILILSAKIGNLLASIKFSKSEYMAKELSYLLKFAGNTFEKITPYQFMSLQILSMIAGIVFCIIFIGLNFFTVVFAIVFFLIPYLKLKEIVSKKREQIILQLPDVADLLSIMLSAGLNFYSAAEKVTQVLTGPLSDVLKDALLKIQLGSEQKIALLEMAQKTRIDRLEFFSKTIIRSLESGSQMSEALKFIAKDLRNENASLSEKKAHQAPVKILLPLVLLIFPTIFIAIFGPIIINLLKAGL
jgi:tight adherence protein C